MLRTRSYRYLAFLLLMSFCVPVAWSQEKPAAYVVEDTPLAQISHDLSTGKVSAVAITKAYIERIRTYDGQLHSVIRIAPDALEQAAASDKRRKVGHALGPLDGVPIMLKDNID